MRQSAIVISNDGLKTMNISADFRRYAAERGIRDPFEVSRKLVSKHTKMNADGSISVDIEWDEKTGKIKEYAGEPTRAEKDAYIMMRDEYVARRVFEEVGYEAFLAHTNPDKTYDISFLRNELFPCQSADKQCSFDCPKFADCALNDTWKPD